MSLGQYLYLLDEKLLLCSCTIRLDAAISDVKSSHDDQSLYRVGIALAYRLSGGKNSVGWTIWGFGIYFQYLGQVIIKLTIVKNFKISSLFSVLGLWFAFYLYWIP